MNWSYVLILSDYSSVTDAYTRIQDQIQQLYIYVGNYKYI